MENFIVQSVNGRQSISRTCFDTLRAALEFYRTIYQSGYPIRILKAVDRHPVAVVKSDWWHLLRSFGFVEK